MKPVHPSRTADIKSPISLLLKPVITTWRTKVNFGREMVQAKLHMLNTRHRKACHNEQNPLPPIWQEGDQQRVPNPKRKQP